MFKLINKYEADVYSKERLHFEGWIDEYQNYVVAAMLGVFTFAS